VVIQYYDDFANVNFTGKDYFAKTFFNSQTGPILFGKTVSSQDEGSAAL